MRRLLLVLALCALSSSCWFSRVRSKSGGACESDSDCASGLRCDDCGRGSCDDCDDCVPACVPE